MRPSHERSACTAPGGAPKLDHTRSTEVAENVFLLHSGSTPTKMKVMTLRAFRRLARNDHFDWSKFDADAYCAENYHGLRDDDHEIVRRVAEFFAEVAAQRGPQAVAEWRAVDVGTGSNLYPAFGLLPFCGSLELVEYSETNIAWLRGQMRAGFDPHWDAFLKAYSDVVAYKDYLASYDMHEQFASKVTITQGSIFDLPRRQWDLGTMFFVACSLSRRRAEFERAVRKFISSLKVGAPYAIGFMTNSGGYHVQGEWFPAVSIDVTDICDVLGPVSVNLEVASISSHLPVREGVGMALATGFAN